MTLVPVAGTPTTVLTSASGGTSLAIPYPSGLQAGEVLLLSAANGTPAAMSTPSGWTLLESGSSINSDLTAIICWKVATGTESGSVTVSWTGTGPGTGSILSVSQVASSSQIRSHVHTATASISTSSPSSLTALSPAPNSTDLVVRYYQCSTNSQSTITAMGTPGGTWTQLANTHTAGSSSTFNNGIVIACKQDGTDNQVITVSGSSASSAWMVTDVSIVGGTSSSTAADLFNLNVPLMRASLF